MKRTAAWLVPFLHRGSGGHRTIFQNVNALAAAGYDCHVYLEPAPPNWPDRCGDAAAGRALAERFFGPIEATFHLGQEIDRPFDVALATAWYTADVLRRSRLPRHKLYFVQDYEAYFSPMGDGFVAAQNSYRYGLRGVTIGRWLTARLTREFAMPCSYFDFCADRSVYRPLAGPAREPAVCFVYQPQKARRCTLVGGQALAIVKREMPDAAIYFYGTEAPPRVDYDVEHMGMLSVQGCNALYNRCQVGLCISTTNPSRIPFEMMAAGLPVVDVHGENNLYDMPEDAASLAEPTAESIAYAILRILRDPAAQRARSAAGTAFMADRDLSRGYEQFVAFVDAAVSDGAAAVSAAVEPMYRASAVRAPADFVEAHLTGLARTPEPYEPPPAPPRLLATVRKRLKRSFKALLLDP